eukprot:scaffold449306_cov15-Prasinocladus_malaysianus.AAC.1
MTSESIRASFQYTRIYQNINPGDYGPKLEDTRPKQNLRAAGGVHNTRRTYYTSLNVAPSAKHP